MRKRIQSAIKRIENEAVEYEVAVDRLNGMLNRSNNKIASMFNILIECRDNMSELRESGDCGQYDKCTLEIRLDNLIAEMR